MENWHHTIRAYNLTGSVFVVSSNWKKLVTSTVMWRMSFWLLCVFGTRTHQTFMLQLNICSTLAPSLVSWPSTNSVARCQCPGGDSLFHVGICCKLLFGDVLFTEPKEGPLGTRCGLEGRRLINSQLLYVMSYQFCWQYEAQWYPSLWTQLACDGCRYWSEVSCHFLATDNSFLCTWIQALAPWGRCWNIIGA